MARGKDAEREHTRRYEEGEGEKTEKQMQQRELDTHKQAHKQPDTHKKRKINEWIRGKQTHNQAE